MTVTASPPEVDSDPIAQALFEEARRRRRNRYFWSLASLLVVIAVAGFVASNRTGPPLRHTHHHGELPRWTVPTKVSVKAPSTFVSGDGKGGIGLYAIGTGTLIHTISPESGGDLDQEMALSANRKRVYFAQQEGTCSGRILSVPVSGSNVPSIAISIPGTMALNPSPSPTLSNLAWVGDTCLASGSVASTKLYLTNLTTDITTQLGALGSAGAAEISWSRDGKRIAVESGQTLSVIPADHLSHSRPISMEDAPGCRLTSPAFLSGSNQLAAIRYCWSTRSKPSTSTALVFNAVTGKPTALIASAPRLAAFQGISVDRTGTRILLGLAGPSSASIVEFKYGRLVTVSTSAPTDAQW
jgi:DNA-binding beta-propeller fold protein YncE